MQRSAFLPALAVCLALFGVVPANASSANLLEQMKKEGWQLVAPGVLQRDLGPNKTETLGFGADGLRFKIQQMSTHLTFLREEYAQKPTPALRKAIRSYKAEIERLTQALKTAQPIDESDGLEAMGEKVVGIDCTIKYGAHVDAFALGGGSQGVGATTDSYFNSNCGQVGEVYAHAYSKATGADNVIRTATKTDPVSGVRSGGNVTAAASNTVLGVRDCYSYSYATMTSYDLGVSYSQSIENRSCPIPITLRVDSSVGTSLHIYGTDCLSIMWSPVVSGGTSPYSYTWYNGATYLGLGAYYSKSFCGDNTTKTQTYTITTNVTDGTTPTPQTKSASHTTTIYYHGTTTTTGCVQSSTSDKTSPPPICS
ncbi:MAG TPA: SprB repeat-containing protein [Thermoanaerobaculia bacterium]|nr:SprB repeat-containing protein [Thermoanaerobaculia bacterium]